MAFIYDLDNEGGGQILADAGTTAPALKINSNSAGYPALAIQSTASGSAVQITAIQGAGLDVDGVSGIGIDADTTSTTLPAGDFRSGATIGPALIVGRTVRSSPTIAPFKILGPISTASAAVIEFGGGFLSCISVALTATNTDYVLPVSLNGVIRGIPLVSLAEVGGAAF